MTKEHSWTLIDWLLVLLVLAAAGGARAWYMCEYAGCGEALQVWHVQDAAGPTLAGGLEEVVGGLRDGGNLAPLYPLLRAAVEKAAPSFLPPPEATLRWLQVGLSSLAAACYFALALRAFGCRLVALLAGLFCALNPFWIINAAELNDGALTSFMLAAALALGARAGQQGGHLTSLFYGVVLAALALARAALLPFGIVALLWFLLRSRTLRQGWLQALLASLGFITVLNLWYVPLSQPHQQPLAAAEAAWWHLWIGNNGAATGGPLTEAMKPPAAPEAPAPPSEWKPSGRYESLAQEVWTEVGQYPGDALRRRLFAAVYFFTGASVLDPQRQEIMTVGRSNESSAPTPEVGVTGTLYGVLFGMLVLGVIGWRWSHGWWREMMPLQLALFWIPLPYVLGHAEWLHGPRLPLDGPLLTLAAFAVVCLLPGVGGPLLRGSPATGEEGARA